MKTTLDCDRELPPAPCALAAAGDHAIPAVAHHPPTGPALPITCIEPPRRWYPLNLKELWRYRELIAFLVWRDVKVRYKQTALGAAWSILQPLMMMLVFTVLFDRMAKVPAGNVPYPVFSLAGLLPWTFFSSAMSNAANSVVTSQGIVTKVYFPRLAMPLAAIGAAFVDFAIAFGVLLVMMAWYHVVPGIQIVVLPVIVVFLAFAATGIGSALAALNVSYRDFRYVIPFFVQLWMFATPTIYMQPGPGSAAGKWAFLLWLNPLSPLIAGFRAAALGGRFQTSGLAAATTETVLLAAAGYLYFRKSEHAFADII